ncbi:MAG: fatty acid desaturase [Deltaproteobacteria bacterium]|nr:fatty acid desaturase [Deltaproteobacteria bacterium]
MFYHPAEKKIFFTALVLALINIALLVGAWALSSMATVYWVAYLFGVFVIQFKISPYANTVQHSVAHSPVFKNSFLNACLSIFNALFNSKNPPFLWNVHHALMHHLFNNGQGDLSRTHQSKNKRYAVLPYMVKFTVEIVPIFTSVLKLFKNNPEEKNSDFIRKSDLKYLWIMPLLLVPYLALIILLTLYAPLVGLTYAVGAVTTIFEVSGLNFLQHAWDTNQGSQFNTPYRTAEQILKSSTTNVSANYNARYGNAGHHAAHHLFPLAHWSEYPKISKQLIQKAVAEAYDKEIFLYNTSRDSTVLILEYILLGSDAFFKKYRITAEEALEILDRDLSKASVSAQGQLASAALA